MLLKAFQKFHPITPDIKDNLEWLPLRSSHIQRKNYFYFAFVALCGALQTHFHGRGRNGKPHLQRRFLRKRGAAGGRLLPLGGAVAQRLRGFKSAEPEKTVKRSSRRTGVNLQFFPVQPSPLGLKGASSPFFVAPARRNRWHFSGSLLVSKENIPGCILLPQRGKLFRRTKSPGGRCGRRGFSEILGLSVHSLL